MLPKYIIRDGEVYVLKSALFGLFTKSRADALKMVQEGKRAPRGWVAVSNGKDVMSRLRRRARTLAPRVVSASCVTS